MDETYVKIKDVEHYLYRAVDSQGNTFGFCLRKNRYHNSTMAFLTKLIKQYGEPTKALVSDKNPAVICPLKKLRKKKLLRKTEYRNVYRALLP